MKIDYISDLHMDFYVKHNTNHSKWKQQTEKFLEELLPNELGEVLIIAGDLSHYNMQSSFVLEYFSKLYKQVLFVLGNHDYYLISDNQSRKYKHNSKNREYELTSNFFLKSSNVIPLLDFEIYEHKGVKFAGSTNWYSLSDPKDRNFFNTFSNDSKLIKGINIELLNKLELQNYNKLNEVDVIVTHVPPIIINSHHKYDRTSCYLNELKPFKAKHWIFGHCHEQNVYEKEDVKFYVNALGYPNEFLNWMNPLVRQKEKRIDFWTKWKKIKSFEV